MTSLPVITYSSLLYAIAESRMIVVQPDISQLSSLPELLAKDLPFEQTEEVESRLKTLLREIMARPVPGETARRLALFQKEIGLILKYKSYAVKAASPLGYAIFLQNDGEGFSFQRHVTHKTEIFHILEVKPGGFVFLCDFVDWEKHYDEEVFAAWLAGEPHPFFDRCRFTPEPGDVFVISELGTVHTVVGCNLEEYATVSTDMVVRLHDQNAGKQIPARFNREYSNRNLRRLQLPSNNRMVDLLSGAPAFAPIEPVEVPGGQRWILADSFVTASRYRLSGRTEGAIRQSPDKATSLRVFKGRATLAMAGCGELDRLGDHAFEVGESDVMLIPPGVRYRLANETSGDLEYSEHQIRPEVAFV